MTFASAVHPHVRGDRARRVTVTTSRTRFTPTCVGIANPRPFDNSHTAVHPHVRGDRVRDRGHQVASLGSPPRAWGSRRVALGPRRRVRFTPTCVGIAFHGVQASKQAAGSPPRAWGSPRTSTPDPPARRFTPTCVGIAFVVSVARLYPVRFTPTCVGIARTRPPPRSRRAVHPHVRGDRVSVVTTSVAAIGSPPRAWGSPQFPKPSQEPDGSPPRAWGSLEGAALQIASERFTPTCVGIAHGRSCDPSASSVHPHVRGDRSIADLTFSITPGSPPRAWGSRHFVRPGRGRPRFTPTCVGIATVTYKKMNRDHGLRRFAGT